MEQRKVLSGKSSNTPQEPADIISFYAIANQKIHELCGGRRSYRSLAKANVRIHIFCYINWILLGSADKGFYLSCLTVFAYSSMYSQEMRIRILMEASGQVCHA